MELVAEAKRAIASFRRNPFDVLWDIIPQLVQLKTELRETESMRDRLSAFVLFFDILSRWQDDKSELDQVIKAFSESNFLGKHHNVIERLTALRLRFELAGRGETGTNRSKVGQKVTDEMIFVGNIYGLDMMPVSHWKKQADEPKGFLVGTDWEFRCKDMSEYEVIVCLAENFMRPSIKSVQKLVDELCVDVA